MPGVSKLRAARMKALFKQNQAAALIGITQAYLCMMENEVVIPTDEMFRKMARVYKCHVSDLK